MFVPVSAAPVREPATLAADVPDLCQQHEKPSGLCGAGGSTSAPGSSESAMHTVDHEEFEGLATAAVAALPRSFATAS